MKAQEIAKAAFNKSGLPLLNGKYRTYTDSITAGLIGEGSECFGFDDEISRDHDWQPVFSLFVNNDLPKEVFFSLKNDYLHRCETYEGFLPDSVRRGVFRTDEFYKRFINTSTPPQTIEEWWLLPEEYLATATNGNMFLTNDCEFIKFRNKLLEFYPEEIIKKKISAHLFIMAQTGQYNYPRSILRQDYSAALLAKAGFVENSMKLVCLFNNTYAPFYKWLPKTVEKLPVLGKECCILAEKISISRDGDVQLIEDFCTMVAKHLQLAGLSSVEDNFLQPHAFSIRDSLSSSFLKSQPINKYCG